MCCQCCYRGRTELGDITVHNIKQLKRLNQVVFPVTYNEKFYQDVLEVGELAKLGSVKVVGVLVLAFVFFISGLSCQVADVAAYRIPPFCPVCCVVLFQPRLCHISLYTCIFLRFRHSLLFSGMSTSILALFSLHLLLFHPHHMAVPFELFLCIFLVTAFTTLQKPIP